jgi:hypothetical protein
VTNDHLKEESRRKIMSKFKQGSGSWTQYRDLPGEMIEVDLHRSPEDRHPDDRDREWVPYSEKMAQVKRDVLGELKDAYEGGVEWLLVIHGRSTSGPFKMTSRSVVRQLMRSKETTPYIRRSACIQHETVFVAAIRPKPPKPVEVTLDGTPGGLDCEETRPRDQ